MHVRGDGDARHSFIIGANDFVNNDDDTAITESVPSSAVTALGRLGLIPIGLAGGSVSVICIKHSTDGRPLKGE